MIIRYGVTDAVCEAVCALCHPQALFEEYLRVGYYPFYDGDEQEYYSRIENVVSFIIDQELMPHGLLPCIRHKDGNGIARRKGGRIFILPPFLLLYTRRGSNPGHPD